MNEESVCPECNGTGVVEVETDVDDESTMTYSTLEEDCRCCFGTGKI